MAEAGNRPVSAITVEFESITPRNWAQRLGAGAERALFEGLMRGGLIVNTRARENLRDLPGTVPPHIAAPHILSGHLRRSITTLAADDRSGVFVGVARPGTPGEGGDAGTPTAGEEQAGRAAARSAGLKYHPVPAAKYGPRVERSVHFLERALESERDKVMREVASTIRRAVRAMERPG